MTKNLDYNSTIPLILNLDVTSPGLNSVCVVCTFSSYVSVRSTHSPKMSIRCDLCPGTGAPQPCRKTYKKKGAHKQLHYEHSFQIPIFEKKKKELWRPLLDNEKCCNIWQGTTFFLLECRV